MEPQKQILDADKDSEERVKRSIIGTPLPPKKEPKVKVKELENGTLIVVQ